MKKNYIAPAQRSVEIDATEMMAWSFNKAPLNVTVDTSDEEKPVENTSFDAKGNGVWDTEW